MICRLLQERSAACLECGAATMISLERGAEGLKFGNIRVQNTPSTRKERFANAAGMFGIVAGYAGIIAGAALWWPAIPMILGAGVGGIGVAAWRSREAEIAQVELLPVATAATAVTRRGIARKLSETVKSVVDGAAVLVEQVVVLGPNGDVLLRRMHGAPFVVDVEGERVVVAGMLRITSKATPRKLKKGEPVAGALGIPDSLPVAGTLAIAQVRDGDRIAITGVLSVEMVPELAFHRDAGEANVMRGAANAVVAIACEEGQPS
jgi:hypothetical protein